VIIYFNSVTHTQHHSTQTDRQTDLNLVILLIYKFGCTSYSNEVILEKLGTISTFQNYMSSYKTFSATK